MFKMGNTQHEWCAHSGSATVHRTRTRLFSQGFPGVRGEKRNRPLFSQGFPGFQGGVLGTSLRKLDRRLVVIGVCCAIVFLASCVAQPMKQDSEGLSGRALNKEMAQGGGNGSPGPGATEAASPLGASLNQTAQGDNIPKRRAALIIGNGEYVHYGKLPNVKNDTSALAVMLTSLGFDVTIKKDLDLGDMKEEIDLFENRLEREKYDTALFYFAGHGAQVGGKDYLCAVRADIENEDQIKDKAYLLDMAIDKICGAKCRVNIIIIDACRDNPFMKGLWGRPVPTVGLIVRAVSAEMFLAYSVTGGTTARDGSGENSPFAKYLLRYIAEPGLSIDGLFMKVRDGVQKETGGKQEVTFRQVGANERILVVP